MAWWPLQCNIIAAGNVQCIVEVAAIKKGNNQLEVWL